MSGPENETGAKLDTRRKLAIEVLTRHGSGILDHQHEGRILVRCPGQSMHTVPNKDRDCMLHLDEAPTISCFHTSCRERVDAANKDLRRTIAIAEASERGRMNSFAKPHLGMGSVPRSHLAPMMPPPRWVIPTQKLAEIEPGSLKIEPIPHPLRKPSDDLKLYLGTLFKAEDIVSFVTAAEYDTKTSKWSPDGPGCFSRTAGELMDDLERTGSVGEALHVRLNEQAGAWIRHNPVDGVLQEGARGMKDGNVVAFRHVLVESDQIPQEKQLALVRTLKLPCAVIVDSGGKSIHAIVRIDAKDKEEYGRRVSRLYAFLEVNGFGGHPLGLDRQNRNAGRLSRMPGVNRGGRMQHVIDVNVGHETWATFESSVLQPWEDTAKGQATAYAGELRNELDEPAEVVPVFPLDYLVGLFRDYVVAHATAAGCDPVMIAYPMLSAVGACMGSRCRIFIKPGWSEPAVLWTAIVAPSGSLKTPMYNLALEGIKTLVKLRRKTIEPVCHEDGFALPQSSLDALHDKAACADGPRFMVSDLTPERLVQLLEDNPHGVLVAVEELASWFGGLSKYRRSGDDGAFYLPLHTGATVDYDRKTGARRHVHLDRATICITGTIQPEVLGKCLGDENFQNGMAARFLFAMPDISPRQWREGSSEPNLESANVKAFARLIGLRPNLADPEGEKKGIWEFEPAARARFIAFVNDHGKEIESAVDERVRSFLSKLEGACARMALIRAGMRYGAGQPTCQKVTLEDVDEAIKLVEYAKAQNLRVYERLGTGGSANQLEKLIAFLRSNPGPHSMRDMVKKAPYLPAKHAHGLLQQLAGEGKITWIECPSTGKGGRPTVKFQFMP